MIQITEYLFLEEKEISEEFIRSSGPGGQNVNKVATAVQLRFDVIQSDSIPADVKVRLIRIAGKRITTDGVLIITARKHRTQEKNRQDALERLVSIIRNACEKPKIRKKTNPTRASKEFRLENKRKKSIKKKNRGPKISPDESV